MCNKRQLQQNGPRDWPIICIALLLRETLESPQLQFHVDFPPRV